MIRGHVLDAQLLREYAVLNFDLYGFYGLSAFQTSADWTQERIMAQKLARAARVTVFEHQTLLEHGLAVLPTGAAPHGDIVMASTSGHRDGQPGDLDVHRCDGAVVPPRCSCQPIPPRGHDIVIVIVLPADLNMEDDAGRNVARLPPHGDFAAGHVAIAGSPGFWSWVIVDAVSDGVVHFHQVTAEEAAEHGDLVINSRVS